MSELFRMDILRKLPSTYESDVFFFQVIGLSLGMLGVICWGEWHWGGTLRFP